MLNYLGILLLKKSNLVFFLKITYNKFVSGSLLFNDKENILCPDIILISANSGKFENDFNYVVHAHPFMEFLFITKGKGSIFIEGYGHLQIKANDLVIINSMVGHTEYSDKTSKLEYIILAATGVNFEKLKSGNPEANGGFLYFDNIRLTDQGAFIFENAKIIYNELLKKEKYYSFVCNNCLKNIIFFLFRRFNLNIVTTNYNALSKEVSYVLQYIDTHLNTQIKMADILSVTYNSKYYLMHNFKKETGMSIFQYVLKRKCEEAIFLLKNSDMSISDIADSLSFSSTSYFYQQFKKYTGHTPLYYRKKAKNEKKSSPN